MKRSLAAALAAALLALGALLTAPAASASEDERVDPAILEMLEAIPGGVVLSETHAVWPELGMDLVVPSSSASSSARIATARSASALAAVGACPSGRVCAFSQAATAGSRLSWTACDTSFPVGSFVVRSVADARSSGYAQARYGTTVRGTANAGHYVNVYGTVSRVTCVS
ncbi:peptidase inhibitor family I36 protein [Microbacterium tumbae]